MTSEIKNIILAGIGSAAYTYEKASKLVDDMVTKGKLTVDEGKELSEELRRNVKTKVQAKHDSVKPLTKEDMAALLKEMNFATKDDLDALNDRILKLEQQSS